MKTRYWPNRFVRSDHSGIDSPASKHGNFLKTLLLILLPSISLAQSGNIDQARNGSFASPISPVNWVNGNAGSSNSHYTESMSVPYRCVVTGLTPGTHYIEIGWDITHSSVNAIDFITHFQRLDPHAQFSHPAEAINPLSGLSGINPSPVSYPIPAPVVNKTVACTNLPQPITTFNALPAGERVMTMYNGTAITNMQYVLNSNGNYGDLNVSSSESIMRITFTTTNSTVVFAWGGHIACAADWCPNNSASGISGSPYHMSLHSVDGAGGNQDRSLSAAAVISVPPCDISGTTNVCKDDLSTFSISPFIGYTYTWTLLNNTSGAYISGSNTGASVTVNNGNTNGFYTINITMTSANYSGTCTKNVTVNSATLLETHTDYSCNTSQGSINLTVNGGYSPFAYNWSSGQSTEDISGLSSGIYTVTVTDQASCSATRSVVIANVNVIQASISSTTHNNCFNGNNGSMSLLVSGGTAPYTYNWSNGGTTSTISQLSSGSYSVVVTDAHGCSISLENLVISQPAAPLSVSTGSLTAVSCNGGSNGSISLNVSGGTAGYTYLWNNGATTSQISSLSAGVYTATVTDALGCSAVSSAIALAQPATALNTSVAGLAQVSCNNGSNAWINLNVSGGTPPYAFIWSNGASTQNISGITAGSYTVTVTDANGCTTLNSSISVSQPLAPLNASTVSASPASCYGGNNGSITLLVSGGTSPYSFAWNSGEVSQNISNLSSGSYTVSISDANGCTTSLPAIVIAQPAAPLNPAVVSVNHAGCFGFSNGSVSLSVSGGTAPYSFLWSNGASSQNITSLPAGSYSVTVTDFNGCLAAIQAILIDEPPAALAASVSSISNVSCNGGSNGALQITVAGGTAPYSFLWNNGATTEAISGLSTGNYSVTITDLNGCVDDISSILISQPLNPVQASASSTSNVACHGNASGSIDLQVSGGTPGYTYLWSNGHQSQDLNNIPAGSYTVTVTDDNGCIFTAAAIQVTQPAAPISASATTTSNVSCNSGANGAIQLAVNGGTAPYSFLWSNGASTQNIAGLYAGNYVVTITDANGCVSNSSTSISQPPGSLNSSINVSQQVLCFGGQNGSINLSATGGTPPYSFQWSNGETTEDIAGLQAGTYSVIVIDNNGCINVSSAVIAQPAATLSVGITAQSAVACFGGSNGSVDLTVSGGTPPYAFNWSNGASTEDQFALPAGSYTVSVTDANGCSVSQSAISIAGPPEPLSASISAAAQVDCFGGNNGALTVLAAGGTPPYSYLWNNGSSSSAASQLSAGTYSVLVSDANGCFTSLNNLLVSQPVNPLTISASSISPVSCFGGNNGAVNLSVNGGTASYSFHWSNGASSQNLSAVQAGQYSVTVTDANGCSGQVNAISVPQPPLALSSSLAASADVSCFGGSNGSIFLNVAGGTAPYTFNWSNGSSSQNNSAIPAGSYTVTVTDDNGCSTVQTGLVIAQPPAALVAQVSASSDVACFGGNNGSLNLSVAGGTAPYTFNWSNGAQSQNIASLPAGSYSVAITDANGCSTSLPAITIEQPAAALSAAVTSSTPVACFGNNTGNISLSVAGGTSPYAFAWSNGASSQNLSAIPSGSYNVTITDDHGCITSIAAISIAQPPAALQAALAGNTPVDCFGNNSGALSLNVAGGTAPYAFNWSNGSQSQNLSSVPAGSYSVSITDANGCNTSLAGLNISQPPAALASAVASSSNVDCYGAASGSISLSSSGGTPPYSFFWSNGSSLQNITGLTAGSYAVTVTDDNGCSNTLAAILVSQPAAPLAGSAITTQNVSCNSGGNGTVSLSVNGGSPPYAFLWSNAASTQNISGLYSGSYFVTVTDANGCLFHASANVSQPPGALSSSIAVTLQVDCYGNHSGAIALSPAGGTPPYAYLWSNGATSQNLSNLPSGIYSTTITDANGCINTAAAMVTQPAAPLNPSLASTTNVDCFGAGNGVLAVAASGGTAPYTFLWNNGQAAASVSGLQPGSYTVTVTDANGCSAILPALLISQPAAALSASVSSNSPVDCFGGMNGALSLATNGGTPPYNYLWSNGALSSSIANLMAGSYDATITDANGCVFQVTGLAVIQPPAALNANTSAITSVSCFGGNNGAISLSVTGGTAPYAYLWNTGDTLASLAGLDSGAYAVQVTDINGCSTSLSGIAVSQPLAPLAPTATVLQHVDCFGGVNGLIDLNTAGGTVPYTFLWSNGDTNEDAANLSSGTYTVIVTDANGCTGTASAKIGQPDTILVANISSVTDVACYGELTGLINISVQGGTYPYYYLWSNGMTTKTISGLAAGSYSVTVTDSKGCSFALSAGVSQPAAALTATIAVTQQVLCFGAPTGAIDLQPANGTPPYSFYWSNGNTSEDLAGAGAGTYTVTLTDANGCTILASATIGQPSGALVPLAQISQLIDCYNNPTGAIDLSVTMGTPPYAYLWSNGATSQDIASLNAGTYTVTVTDANGCTASLSVVMAQPLSPLSASAHTTAANCLFGSGGTITTFVNGGTAPYVFNWSNGATSQNLQQLLAGSYTVTITDARGCNTTAVYSIADNSIFHAVATGPTEVCIGELVTLSADSIPGVVYQWYLNGQPLQGANSFTFTTPAAGSYTVIVANACGSYVSEPISVTVHQVGQVSTSPNSIICTRDGESAQLYVYGGISYQWNPEQGLNYSNIYNPLAAPLQSTVYTVTITGEFGCQKTATIEVGIDCDTLVIPTGFSPNSDGINDGYTITGIENYPGNKIWIYNRWGNLIFKTHDYNNNWDGISNVSGIYIGKKVPPGTYFYILDLNNHSKPIQGYITLRY